MQLIFTTKDFTTTDYSTKDYKTKDFTTTDYSTKDYKTKDYTTKAFMTNLLYRLVIKGESTSFYVINTFRTKSWQAVYFNEQTT